METTHRLDESARRPAASGSLGVRWIAPRGLPRWLRIEGAPVDVGRGPGVAVALEAAGLSRRHAEIYRQGPACIAHDLGSTNGTHVNAQRVEYAPLAEGDVLRLGDVVGVVARMPSAGAGTDDLTRLDADLLFGPGVATQLEEIRRVAPTDLPVTIVGETGTGKELLARAVHVLSGRRGRLHAVNCPALPAGLAEAELFGHVRGAFTGADHAGLGQLRAAQGGTLFLDELPDLALPIQAKLLRVLQDRQVTPLGETRSGNVDVRVVAACQQPLDDLVATGRLRQDLAARLAGLVVKVPPLRERRLDVGLLFQHFIESGGAGRVPDVDPRLLECLLTYDWPGNVRELELLARRLMALHGHEPRLRRSFLPDALRAHLAAGDDGPAAGRGGRTGSPADRDEHDRRRLAEALRGLNGNLSRAAAAAGLSRARAYRLLDGRSVSELLATHAPPPASRC